MHGGQVAGEDVNNTEAAFVAFKENVSPEAFAAYTQGRSEDINFPDLRLIRYDPQVKVIGVVESGHPAHEAVGLCIAEQITLQMAPVPPAARLVPLGSPSTPPSSLFSCLFDSIRPNLTIFIYICPVSHD